ncbi:hypothetical protein PRIPAC_92807 [Pristionchus pacificus]|uniref:Uncharacterized protein n=1 Tax=Pristionchus pacificus TaxID=54126 RepID=A0A2A6CDB4_PRIPA|nr:hypothetical protein PRIPAC_92807 [Pristionchus pacificus]|eukprot:PDM76225.1 hypothetical protein PRIPAC_39829 [Pristionchus pacificus]
MFKPLHQVSVLGVIAGSTGSNGHGCQDKEKKKIQNEMRALRRRMNNLQRKYKECNSIWHF